MKLAEKVGNVVLSENLTVHKFRVSINRQSFKLLYGDLYSDKVRAIIRELSTNACDSHILLARMMFLLRFIFLILLNLISMSRILALV